MLDAIRTNTQSFGIKLAFGIIIVVFVFWGVGSINEGDTVNLAATVNGDSITARDFEMAYRRAEENLLQRNPGLRREQFKAELGRQVLRNLVDQALLTQEAQRVGVTVTPTELRAAVEQVKAFQNEKGQFDGQAYQRVLEAQHLTPAQYEQDMRDALLRQKMYDLVTAAVWTDPKEVRQRYQFLREKRVVDYLFLPASRYLDEVKPTEADVKAYYDEHTADFAIPAKVSLTYVRVTPEALVKPESLSEAQVRAWYEANKSRFSQEEQVKAAHILVPLAEDAAEADVQQAQKKAQDILAELKAGASFAAVADAHNGPNAAGPGGDLGWIKRGMTVAPFETAAFALEPGTISEVIRSPFGLHIIRVEEKRPAHIRAFDDVVQEARQALAQEKGTEILRDALDTLIEDNILGKPLEKSAQTLGLTAQETGPSTAAELTSTLAIAADDAAAILKTPANTPVDRALEAGDAYLIVRVRTTQPAATEPLDAVQESIRRRLQETQALQTAMKNAAKRRKTLQDGTLSPAQQTEWGVRTAAPMERDGALEGFAPLPDLAADVFTARAGQWLARPFAVTSSKEGSGAVLVHVNAVLPPEASEWDAIQTIMTGAAQRDRAEAVFALFMQQLFSKARVEVRNADLVNRKGL